MKMNANDFVVSNDSNSKILYGNISNTAGKQVSDPPAQIFYPMSIYDSSTSSYVDYTVPEGTIIIINIVADRPGTGDGDSKC